MTNPHGPEGGSESAYPQVSELLGWCPSGEFKSPSDTSRDVHEIVPKRSRITGRVMWTHRFFVVPGAFEPRDRPGEGVRRWRSRYCASHLCKQDMPARRLVAVAQACGVFRGRSAAEVCHSRGGGSTCSVGSGRASGGSEGLPGWVATLCVLALRGWMPWSRRNRRMALRFATKMMTALSRVCATRPCGRRSWARSS